jgi:hypothetical protein
VDLALQTESGNLVSDVEHGFRHEPSVDVQVLESVQEPDERLALKTVIDLSNFRNVGLRISY